LAVVSAGQFISNAQPTEEAGSAIILHGDLHGCSMVLVEGKE